MTQKLNIIIARYNEDIKWIEEISENHNVNVYNKGKPLDLDGCNMRQIDNLGREAETYVNFIVNNYEAIQPDSFYVFLQGDPFYHGFTLQTLEQKFINDYTPFFKKKGFEFIDGPINKDFPSGLPFSLFIDLLFSNIQKGRSRFFYPAAQFAVKGSCIKNRDVHFYKILFDMLQKLNPIEAHLLERSWHIIFNNQVKDRFTEYYNKRTECVKGASWGGKIE